jgi:tetratricopeptide (TPR) repeat protein
MKKLIKFELIFIILILTTSFFACTNTSKKVTVSDNTEEDILVEENQVAELINTGKKLLSDEKYDEAMTYYSKAIELDKSNKDVYLKIKDIYLESNRPDDAYFITKTAISNNIDAENMKKIANDISSQFQVILINDKVEQDSEYYFPQNINTTINGKSISLPIKWDYIQANTGIPGAFEFYGFNEEYGRKVQINLTVSEIIYSKQIGCIKNIYTVDGRTYIDVDLVEFYLGGEIATKEALKDNIDLPLKETGEAYIPDGYYIRNNYDKITTYEISEDCSFQLLHHDLTAIGYNTPAPNNSSITETASFDDFKNYINLRIPMDIGDHVISNDKPITQRETLCWIELKNDVVYSIYRQYTP